MKRSEINEIIKNNIEFIQSNGFNLPPFATWTLEEWKSKGREYDDIRNNSLGWDVSDYGCGDFYKLGIVAFTIRNGNQKVFQVYEKPFAEKLLILEPRQEIPLHFHPSKVEDLINRGKTDIMIKLYHSNPDYSISEKPVDVLMDGHRFTIGAGEIIKVKPGESITLVPRQYHTFWSESDKALLGEVTMTNNDHYFYNLSPSPTIIEEDVLPLYLLSNEY